MPFWCRIQLTLHVYSLRGIIMYVRNARYSA
jgi:hypothetical protein